VSSHLPPFFCPYCGEEDIRPHGEAHGEWACGSCRRVFALRAVRPSGRELSGPSGAPGDPAGAGHTAPPVGDDHATEAAGAAAGGATSGSA